MLIPSLQTAMVQRAAATPHSEGIREKRKIDKWGRGGHRTVNTERCGERGEKEKAEEHRGSQGHSIP